MTVETGPNNAISARETAGQRVRVSALLAAPVEVSPANSADTSDQDFPVASTWAEYDVMLAAFDRGEGPEPQGPRTREHHPRDPDAGPSDRTERRRRGERKSEIQALLARDGRATVESATRRVRARKTSEADAWLKVCDNCGAVFESKRDDAKFCSDRCRKRVARRGDQP